MFNFDGQMNYGQAFGGMSPQPEQIAQLSNSGIDPWMLIQHMESVVKPSMMYAQPMGGGPDGSSQGGGGPSPAGIGGIGKMLGAGFNVKPPEVNNKLPNHQRTGGSGGQAVRPPQYMPNPTMSIPASLGQLLQRSR